MGDVPRARLRRQSPQPVPYSLRARLQKDEAGDDEGVARLQGGQGALELGPGGTDRDVLVAEDGGAAGGGEGVADVGEIVAGTGVGVADGGHSTPMTRDSRAASTTEDSASETAEITRAAQTTGQAPKRPDRRSATGRRSATVSISADLERRVSGVGLAFPPPV
jgi:hypothetical protein